MVLRIRSIFEGVAGSPYYSNLYFGGTISTDAEERADRVMAFWNLLNTSLTTPMTVRIDPFVASIDEPTGEITGGFTITPPTPVQFTNTTTQLPRFTQLLVKWSTPTYNGGRRLQGRMFIPGFCEVNNNAGGRPDDAIRAAVLTNLQPLITGPDRVGVYSKTFGVFSQVDGASVGAEWAVLRSRRD